MFHAVDHDVDVHVEIASDADDVAAQIVVTHDVT